MTQSERLKLARLAAGLDTAAVAQDSEVDEKDILAFEAGTSKPEPEQLWYLAQTLNMDLGFFLRTLPVAPILAANPEGVRGETPEANEQILAQARIAIERYLDVEAFFPIEESPMFNLPDGFPISVTSAKEAADAGEALRRAWGLGHLPISSLADLLEDAGIKMAVVPGVEGFDGAAFVTDDDLEIPFIVARRDIPGDAQRFALARELAFLVLDGATFQTASHFAGALLAPAHALRYELGVTRTNLEFYELQLMKQKYGMSMRRLVTRAASLRIISKDELERWLTVFRDGRWQQEEPGFEFPAEQPGRMIRLVLRLQAEGEIEPERAAELLGVPEDDWIDLLNFDEEPELELAQEE